MTIAHASHAERIAGGIGFEWDRLPEKATRIAQVDLEARDVGFRRERNSHVGLHRFTAIRRLWADAVDASFLEEIAAMQGLELLSISRVTASDLRPLASLPHLRRLVVRDATRVADLEWVRGVPKLEALGLENLSRVTSLEPLSTLTRLRGLGVEGSMWTAMRVETLAPLRTLKALEYLFLTNVRVGDRSLRPLHELTSLRALQCARRFDDAEFAALHSALPDLSCGWFARLPRASGGPA